MTHMPHTPGLAPQSAAPSPSTAKAALLPLGAMLLAGSLNALAQTAPTAEATLSTVTVKEQAEPEEVKAKNTLRATESTIGKGKQALRDIPQTVTVITEKLINDRNLDDFREVLKSTAGVTFLAGETGEEDVRLRGFSLSQSGDIYVDGLRDVSIIERDTFNQDRVEVLKGSASMLFGKGSTGGVVNQVSKEPFLMDQHEVNATLGTGNEIRLSGDFNLQTGPDAALRINAMAHDADNAGASVNKKGIATTYRWGIGLRDEFSVGLYHLETDGRPQYLRAGLTDANGVIVPLLDAEAYYGLASDFLKTDTTHLTFSHTHRFDHDTQIKTRVRHGHYERDLLASVVTFASGTNFNNFGPSTVLNRSPKGRVAISDITQIQSDYTSKFEAAGLRHDLIAGVDFFQEKALRDNSAAGNCTGGNAVNGVVGSPGALQSCPLPRGDIVFNRFKSDNIGLYAQDTVSLTDTIKLVGGLRFDKFKASYLIPGSNGAADTQFSRSENVWSPRVGALFQPNDTRSYYVSYGESYNLSGDTYQFTPQNPSAKDANTPAETSRNIEIGAKFEFLNKTASLGVALFYSEKFNERNLDEDDAATRQLLSGKRHATGMEFNFAGRLTPLWELFYNHTWIPSARIDVMNAATSACGRGCPPGEGDRPGLTPKHSASLWTTYRVASNTRIGFGLNYRSKQTPLNSRTTYGASFMTADAMVEQQITEQTSLRLNVTNLTDKQYADGLYASRYTPGTPRTVQLTLKHLF